MTTKKITKKTREQAILVASAMSCSRYVEVNSKTAVAIQATLGVSDAAYALWWSTWKRVAEAFEWKGDPTNPEWDAEAECLLREGFTP